ncbi:MAG: T9SS type A sorting domain-containing protein [Candidatus Margulisbacteria bacterium]|nr:T9SS type A sorting domain-containing protein [Candidatus Margulisiibacteriota bacterium]
MKRLGFILLLCAGLSAAIGDFYFYGHKYQPGITVGTQPELTVAVSGNRALLLEDFELYLDTDAPAGLLPTTDYRYNEHDKIFRYNFSRPLERGAREIILKVRENANVMQKSVTVQVIQEKNLLGDLIIFPSPATRHINVCYELGSAQNISFLLYDLNGRLVLRRDFQNGQPGGRQGYNQANIDLDAYSKSPLANGVYIAALLKPGSRAVLAKEKFIILK